MAAPAFIVGNQNTKVTLPNGLNMKIASLDLTTGAELLNITGFGDTRQTRILGLADLMFTVAGFGMYGTSTTANTYSLAAAGPLTPFPADQTASGSTTITFAVGCTMTFNCWQGPLRGRLVAGQPFAVTVDLANADSTAPTVVWAA